MLTKTVVRTGVNPNVLREKNHPGDCVVSEVGNYQCRGNRMVAGGMFGVPHNSVLLKVDGHFDGVVLEGVRAGETAMRGVIENGPCELSEARLDWSLVVVTNAVDGPKVERRLAPMDAMLDSHDDTLATLTDGMKSLAGQTAAVADNIVGMLKTATAMDVRLKAIEATKPFEWTGLTAADGTLTLTYDRPFLNITSWSASAVQVGGRPTECDVVSVSLTQIKLKVTRTKIVIALLNANLDVAEPVAATVSVCVRGTR